MKTALPILAIALALALPGCSAPKPTGVAADPRAGTEASPYRTIPTAIQCDDCRMPGDR